MTVGPPLGASNHCVPDESFHAARLPQVPWVWKFILALEMRSDRNNGVSWLAPPSDLLSRRKKRPSFPPPTMTSRPSYGKMTGVVSISKSRLVSHSWFDGV